MRVKKLLLSLFVLVTVLTGCSSSTDDSGNAKTEESGEVTLVVASFNVDAKAPENDVNDQRKLLEEEDVEVFGLQEVDYNLPRYDVKKYNPLDDFAKGDYTASFFGESVPKSSEGGYGNAIVSKYAFIEEEVVALTSGVNSDTELQKQLVDIYKNLDINDDEAYYNSMMEVWGPDGLSAKGAIEPRSYSRVVLEKDGKKIAFYSTHLSVESFEVRTEQMEQLKAALDSDPIEYKIIVGDFNVDEGTNEYNIFTDGYKLANGYDGIWHETVAEEDEARQSVEKGLRVKFLDNIIVSDNIEIDYVKTIETDLSDHYPIIAKIILK